MLRCHHVKTIGERVAVEKGCLVFAKAKRKKQSFEVLNAHKSTEAFEAEEEDKNS